MKIETLSLFDGNNPYPHKIDIPDADITYHPTFFGPNASRIYQDVLRTDIAWQQQIIGIGGRQIRLPRLTAWYGTAAYAYSGIRMEPRPWIPILSIIKSKVEECLQVSFNSVLLNLYRDGNDSVSWHADDEPELGAEPLIASLSFGEERLFQLKRKDRMYSGHLDLLLVDGSLLVMAGQTQRHWLHRIPKTAKRTEPRYNLTFRQVIS